MEKGKQQKKVSSSFTCDDLFGPQESSKPSPSSAGVFESFFGPSSTGLGKNSPQYVASRNQDHGTHYSNPNPGTSEFMEQRKKEETKNKNPTGLWDSSIYYGGQQVYSPSTNTPTTTTSNQLIKKDVNEDDSNGNNWWQGSLYY